MQVWRSLMIGPVQSFMACTQRSNYEVVTERIPYRLETLSALQARNSIVILNAALRGFRAVFQKHAGIDIKQSMIGTYAITKGSILKIESKFGSIPILPSIDLRRTRLMHRS
jgi:hypothetical protein